MLVGRCLKLGGALGVISWPFCVCCSSVLIWVCARLAIRQGSPWVVHQAATIILDAGRLVKLRTPHAPPDQVSHHADFLNAKQGGEAQVGHDANCSRDTHEDEFSQQRTSAAVRAQ